MQRFTRSRSSRGRGRTSFNHAQSPVRRSFSSPKSRRGSKIDYSLFVNKAKPSENTNETIITHVFDDFAFSPMLKANIKSHGFETPTPIQDKAIPVALTGRDVIGLANTGTGKTAAFLLPLITKVEKNNQEKVLIIAPTRELALQIQDELYAFTKGMHIYSVVAIGGSGIHGQIKNLHRGYNFLIATPGRLKDLIEHRAVNMSHFHNIVLDEVDRMVDIGFIRDIKYFISLLPTQRQSLFFSATITPQVDEILKSFVQNAETISVKTAKTAESVEQDIVKIGNDEKKIDILHDLLIQDGFDKVIVFGRTKWGMENLSKQLIGRGFKAASIHGNKSQGQRRRALDAFKNNEVQILIATDVASRGIDVEDVTHVINYDVPESYDDYVHRIGRTGRANKKGMAITFVE